MLITGATGFVGKALTEMTSQAGHEVSAVVRKQSQILPAEVKQIVAGDFLRFVGDFGIHTGKGTRKRYLESSE